MYVGFINLFLNMYIVLILRTDILMLRELGR